MVISEHIHLLVSLISNALSMVDHEEDLEEML